MKREVKQALQDIVGPENVTDSLVNLVRYSYDASEYNSRPEAAVWAESADQVSDILKLAGANGIPVTLRGAGTGLSGVTVPIGKMVDMLAGIQEIRKGYHVVIPVLGHIGDGNLYPYLVPIHKSGISGSCFQRSAFSIQLNPWFFLVLADS